MSTQPTGGQPTRSGPMSSGPMSSQAAGSGPAGSQAAGSGPMSSQAAHSGPTDAGPTAHRIRAADAESQVALDGDLMVPAGAGGLVLFAHGSGSSRHSSRNRAVADGLHQRGLATLLVDLLTAEEEQADAQSQQLRFDIGRLADRLVGIVDWLADQPATAGLPVGLFGASTGAAAALVAAAARPETVRAVVCRGGRPDLAGPAVVEVKSPTLFIVGDQDVAVRDLNYQARASMRVLAEMRIIPGAGHLFEEPGTLEQVTRDAGDWFVSYLVAAARIDTPT